MDIGFGSALGLVMSLYTVYAGMYDVMERREADRFALGIISTHTYICTIHRS